MGRPIRRGRPSGMKNRISKRSRRRQERLLKISEAYNNRVKRLEEFKNDQDNLSDDKAAAAAHANDTPANPLAELLSEIKHNYNESDDSEEDEEDAEMASSESERESAHQDGSDNMEEEDVYNDDYDESEDNQSDHDHDDVEVEESDKADKQIPKLKSLVGPSSQHFDIILPKGIITKLNDKEHWRTNDVKLRKMGHVKSTHFVDFPAHDFFKATDIDLNKMQILPALHPSWKNHNKRHFPSDSDAERQEFTDLQKEMLPIMNSYKDLLFYGRNLENQEEIRDLYCLHVLNHVLKSNSKIWRNTKKVENQGTESDDCRDQGFTRPKVMICVPFRESVLKVVNSLIHILSLDEKAPIANKKRFLDLYGDDTDPESLAKESKKPPDHVATFAGNCDDDFALGITVTKKSLVLFTNFYRCDIIITSPLGLRVIVGAESEAQRDYDFLSSIEILIIDQADVLLMQNWDHLIHCLSHFHLRPKKTHSVDITRVRMWMLNGWGKYYRQTLCFTSFVSPEVNGIFSQFCFNYNGIVRTNNPVVGGAIRQVVVHLPQVFQRFPVTSLKRESDYRYEYFISKILPQFKENIMRHTLIFVPSYFDFIRLRNYFRKEEVNFAQICEYHNKTKAAKERYLFRHGERKFLLYTERSHFYHRLRIRGIRHIIFYQLPSFPHFYSEICNFTHLEWPKAMEQSLDSQTSSCTVVYSRYDAFRLAAVVGTERASQMLSMDKDVHLLITED